MLRFGCGGGLLDPGGRLIQDEVAGGASHSGSEAGQKARAHAAAQAAEYGFGQDMAADRRAGRMGAQSEAVAVACKPLPKPA